MPEGDGIISFAEFQRALTAVGDDAKIDTRLNELTEVGRFILLDQRRKSPQKGSPKKRHSPDKIDKRSPSPEVTPRILPGKKGEPLGF